MSFQIHTWRSRKTAIGCAIDDICVQAKKMEINTFTLQSSPLQERIFSRSFKTVGSDLKNPMLPAGITASPDGWPVTGTISNLDPTQPILYYEMGTDYSFSEILLFLSINKWLLKSEINLLLKENQLMHLGESTSSKLVLWRHGNPKKQFFVVLLKMSGS